MRTQQTVQKWIDTFKQELEALTQQFHDLGGYQRDLVGRLTTSEAAFHERIKFLESQRGMTVKHMDETEIMCAEISDELDVLKEKMNEGWGTYETRFLDLQKSEQAHARNLMKIHKENKVLKNNQETL